MLKVHCSVDHYHQMPLDELSYFSASVSKGVYQNTTVFPAVPMSKPAFDALIDTYTKTRSAYKNGGLAQKGAFQMAKTALLKGLDAIADMVDEVAQGDSTIIILSGNVPTKDGNSSGHIPGTPQVTLKWGNSGVIEAECDKIPGAEHYGCIVATSALSQTQLRGNEILMFGNDADKIFGIALTKPRKKTFTGLTKGTTYYFYFFASNATGVGNLSEVQSLIGG